MRVYKVMFVNQGKVYEIYAKAVHQGEIYGFVELEGLLFGETSKVLVDPSEERLKSEFQGVGRSMVPIHSVIRFGQRSMILDTTRKQGRYRKLPTVVT